MSRTLVASAGSTAAPAESSKVRRVTGRVLTGVAVLFLVMDTTMKLVGVTQAVEGTVQLGFQPQHLAIIGLIELACLVLYLIPRTAPLGAILWTGYFGGAIVTHLRLDNPLFSHILFPTYIAALLWGGLYLRDPRVRALVAANR